MKAHFILSRRGKRKLAHEGYAYIKNTSNPDKKRTYWRCEYFRSGCSGRAITDDQDNITSLSEHNHEPYADEIERREMEGPPTLLLAKGFIPRKRIPEKGGIASSPIVKMTKDEYGWMTKQLYVRLEKLPDSVLQQYSVKVTRRFSDKHEQKWNVIKVEKNAGEPIEILPQALFSSGTVQANTPHVDPDYEQRKSSIHQSHEYNCPFCNVTFCTECALKSHVRQIHQRYNRPFTCEICQESFPIKQTYNSHMHIHNNTLDKLLYYNVAWKYRCHICYSRFSMQSALTCHINKAHNEKKFECYKCKERFYTAAEQIDHVRNGPCIKVEVVM